MAEAARDLGAEVVLVSGPVALAKPTGINIIDVESAAQMLTAIEAHFETSDIVIKTAAVADYRPKQISEQKIKKQQGDSSIELERTVDILATLGSKKTHQLLIGFAAETTDVEVYAKGKLEKKNADYIVANDVTANGAGFGTETNIVTLYGQNFVQSFPQLSKKDLAKRLLETIIEREEIK